jgi:hypothetical protein
VTIHWRVFVWVSNSRSGGDRKLDQISAVGDPPHVVQIGRSHRLSVGERQRRAALQRGVAACGVVQLDNATHTIPSLEKSATRGIRGSVGVLRQNSQRRTWPVELRT